MKKILFMAILVVFASCTTPKVQSEKQVRLNTYRDIILNILTDDPISIFLFRDAPTYLANNSDEINKTFNINEVDTIGNFYAVFYSFSIGSEVARGTMYFTKIPGDTLCTTVLPYTPSIYSWSDDDDILKRKTLFSKIRKQYNMPKDSDIEEIEKRSETWKGNDRPWWWE